MSFFIVGVVFSLAHNEKLGDGFFFEFACLKILLSEN